MDSKLYILLSTSHHLFIKLLYQFCSGSTTFENFQLGNKLGHKFGWFINNLCPYRCPNLCGDYWRFWNGTTGGTGVWEHDKEFKIKIGRCLNLCVT